MPRKLKILPAQEDEWSNFRREDHVYRNDEFDEKLKDAIRYFHGRNVYPMPPKGSFDGVGVYAIYCIARSGIYRKFGETVNRLCFQVPIYVGKSVRPISEKTSEKRFCCLSCGEQLLFWSNMIKSTIGITLNDFQFRMVSDQDFGFPVSRHIQRMLCRKYAPIWNVFFAKCDTMGSIAKHWCLAHSIRFRGKADKFSRDEIARLMEMSV